MAKLNKVREEVCVEEAINFCQPVWSVPFRQPSVSGEASWAHLRMQRAHVAGVQAGSVVLPCFGAGVFSPGFGSAGAVGSSLSSGLPQLELFPSSVNDEHFNILYNGPKSFNIFPDYNFSKTLNINKLFFGSNSTDFSSISCKEDLLLPLQGSKGFSSSSYVSRNGRFKLNANSYQQAESRSPVSIGEFQSNESFPSTSNSLVDLTSNKKSFAEAVVPKVVSESIPIVGCAPDCGIIMQKVSNTYLDDYARAIMDVAGPKSIAFLGKAPGMQDYMMSFLVSPRLVAKVVENGIKVRGVWICVTRVQEPATKVIVSDVLPYIADSEILGACKSFAKPVFDKLRRIPAAVRGSQFSGILSYRREMQLILKRDATLPESIAVFSNGLLHTLQLSTGGTKCYRCAAVGHVAARCKANLAFSVIKNDRAGREDLVNFLKEHLQVPPSSPSFVSQAGRVILSGDSTDSQKSKVQQPTQKMGPQGPPSPTVNKLVGFNKANINAKKKSSSSVEVTSNPSKSGKLLSKEKSVPPPLPPTSKKPSPPVDAIKVKKLSKNSDSTHGDVSAQSSTSVVPSIFCFKSSTTSEADVSGSRQKKAKLSSVLCSDQSRSGAKEKRQPVISMKESASGMIVSEVQSTLALQGSQLALLPPSSSCSVGALDGGELLVDDQTSASLSPRRRRKTAVKTGADGAQDMVSTPSGAEVNLTSNSDFSSNNDLRMERKKFFVVKKSEPQKLNQMQCGEICQSLLDEVFGLKIAKKRVVVANYLTRYPDLDSIIESGLVGMLSAQPGSQVYKTLKALSGEAASIGKKYSVRSSKQ